HSVRPKCGASCALCSAVESGPMGNALRCMWGYPPSCADGRNETVRDQFHVCPLKTRSGGTLPDLRENLRCAGDSASVLQYIWNAASAFEPVHRCCGGVCIA